MHLLDLRSRVPQRLGEGPGVGLHLGLDGDVAERHRQRDPHPAHVAEVLGDGQRRQRDVVDGVLTLDHVVEQGGVGHRAAHRPVVAVDVEVERRQRRHPAVRRLEADHTAEGRGDPDRATDVGPAGQVRRTGRQGRARAAGGSTRGVVGVPGVAGDAPQLGVGEAGAGELGGGRARVDQRARVEDPLGHGVGLVGDEALGEHRAEAQAAPLDRLLLLQHDRQSLERARSIALAGIAGLRCLRRHPEVLVVALQQAVDDRLGLVGPGRHRLQHLDRRQLAASEGIEDLGRAEVVKVGHRGLLSVRMVGKPRVASHRCQ